MKSINNLSSVYDGPSKDGGGSPTSVGKAIVSTAFLLGDSMEKKPEFIPYGDYLGLTPEQYYARVELLKKQAEELMADERRTKRPRS